MKRISGSSWEGIAEDLRSTQSSLIYSTPESFAPDFPNSEHAREAIYKYILIGTCEQ